jgi:oligopeptide transport system substrate-binding protein
MGRATVVGTKMRFYFTHLNLFFIAALYFLSGCNFLPETSLTPLNPKETLTISTITGPEDLNWNNSRDAVSNLIATSLMAGLTKTEVRNAETVISPDLASSISVSSDSLKIIFKINNKVKWSDGVNLKADDFVFAFQNLLNPKNSAPVPDLVYNIKKAKAYNQGVVKNFSEVGITAVDEATLVVSLDESQHGFKGLFSHPFTFPMRRDLALKLGEHWADLDHLVTLGSYRALKFERGKLLALRRNDNSYRAQDTTIKNVIVYFNVNPREAFKMFSSGKVDVVFDIPSKEADFFKERAEFVTTPLFEEMCLVIDVKNKPLSSPIFRRAVGMSIDRADVIRMLGGGLNPIGEMIPPGLIGYESNRGVRFDSDAAVELLKHSGYPHIDTMKIKLFSADDRESRLVAESLQAQMRKNIGLNLELAKESENGLKDSAEIHMHLMNMHFYISDSGVLLNKFKSRSINNISGWKSKNYDDFLFKAEAADSIENKEKLFAKAQHILNDEEMPVIPLYSNSYNLLIQKRVKDFPVNGFRLAPLEGVALE